MELGSSTASLVYERIKGNLMASPVSTFSAKYWSASAGAATSLVKALDSWSVMEENYQPRLFDCDKSLAL